MHPQGGNEAIARCLRDHEPRARNGGSVSPNSTLLQRGTSARSAGPSWARPLGDRARLDRTSGFSAVDSLRRIAQSTILGSKLHTKLRHSPNTRWSVAAGRIKGVRTRFIDGPPSPGKEPLKSRIRHPGEQPRRLPTPVVLPNTIPIALATFITTGRENATNTLHGGVARTSRPTIRGAMPLSIRKLRPRESGCAIASASNRAGMDHRSASFRRWQSMRRVTRGSRPPRLGTCGDSWP